MSHRYHQSNPHYDERQILHDGCPECERRGQDVARFLRHADGNTFEKAWRRAYDLNASEGDRSALGYVTEAESSVLEVLWQLQVEFERRGLPLDGSVPVFVSLRAE